MGGAGLESSLACIGVGDRQGAIGHQVARPIDACIFGDRAGGARRGDDSSIVAAIDGDGDGSRGAVSRFDGEGLGQRIAIAQRLIAGLPLAAV